MQNFEMEKLSGLNVHPIPNCPWGGLIETQLSELSESQWNELGRITNEKIILIARNQSMDIETEVKICRTIGDVEVMGDNATYRCPTSAAGEPIREVQRVTGERDHKGDPTGLFYHNQALDWHANKASNTKERKSIVWLRSIKGAKGSRTSWANTKQAFADLDSETQQRLRHLKGIFGFEPGRYSPVVDFKIHINETPIPLVWQNPVTKEEGLYFPFNQLFHIDGVSSEESKNLIESLKTHVLQEKYMYHHDWEDSDIVLSDQWFSIHKRWPFDVSNRLLHRVTMNWQPLERLQS